MGMAALAGVSAGVTAAPFYATGVADSAGAAPFGGGSPVGAPDGDGLFFPLPDSPGHISYTFATTIVDGPGADIRIFDIGDPAPDPTETGDVLVSSDGIAYTFIASIIGSPVPIDVDIAGLFIGPVTHVRIVNTFSATSADGDGLDIDTVAGLNSGQVPVPMTLGLLLSGLAGMGFVRRRGRIRR